MRIIAIANQKGGSAKTTTAVNLAASLARRDRRVLLIDLDGQCSATRWCGVSPDQGDHDGIYAVFNDEVGLAEIVMPTRMDGVFLAPASPRLSNIERVMAAEPLPQMTLQNQLSTLSDDWDEVLLDCPPQLGLMTVNALVAADEVLVPVEISVMALQGLVQLLNTVEKVRATLNRDLVVRGILPCRADLRTNIARQAIDNLREEFGDRVLTTVIKENVRLKEAPRFCESIFTYAPDSPGAADYRALGDELLDRHREAVPQ